MLLELGVARLCFSGLEGKHVKDFNLSIFVLALEQGRRTGAFLDASASMHAPGDDQYRFIAVTVKVHLFAVCILELDRWGNLPFCKPTHLELTAIDLGGAAGGLVGAARG